MPAKKSPSRPAGARTRKKNTAKKPPQPRLRTMLLQVFLGVGLLVLLLVAAGVGLHLYYGKPASAPPAASPQKTVTMAPPRFEIFPGEAVHAPVPSPAPKPMPPVTAPPEVPRPQVAIIIDDMGYDRKMARRFLDLAAPLTFSVLPFSPFGTDIAEEARQGGVEIMLHLPMEPKEYPRVDPGPGALLTTMAPDQLIRQLLDDIRSVPTARGVNNHMGSRMTAVSTQMYQIFSILKKEGLFFIDSRTTVDTLCKPSARLLRLPFAERDVFLDHVVTEAFVRKQVKALLDVAVHEGRALGIGHPHEVTWKVLREMLPEMIRSVDIVPASRLVRQLG